MKSTNGSTLDMLVLLLVGSRKVTWYSKRNILAFFVSSKPSNYKTVLGGKCT